MDQRDDYAELDARPPLVSRLLFRRGLPIGVLVLLIGAGTLIYFTTRSITDRHDRVYWSIIEAEKLARACRVYYTRYQRFPAQLADLRTTPDGRPLLENPDENFTDAWLNPFRYALVVNEVGQLEPHVWAEWTRDGKTTLVGARLAADGTVVPFGQPDD